MAQHDYTIANQGFPAFRSDLNDALAAIVSNNSGATEPTTMFAHQLWVDTAANPSVLKIRNADNDAWITIGTINQTGDTFTLTSAVSATTLNTSGAVVFNDAGADVDFRVESDTDANAFFLEGSSGNVGIGTSSPSRELVVQKSGGTSIFAERTATSPGFVGLYATDLPAVAWNSSGSLRFATIDDVSGFTNFTERARITSDGYLRMASGSGGIQFGGDTAAANALDDYEEGTWTPVDSSGAGLTFTTPAGVYVKIGKLVCIQGYLVFPSTANGSNIKIGGLPFAPAAGTVNRRGNLDSSTETTAKYCFPDEASTFTEVFDSSATRITNATFSGDSLGFTLIFQVA